MNDLNTHPTEEELGAFALDEQGDDSIRLHIISCSACSEFVEDVRFVRDELLSIKEEEIPSALNKNLLSSARFQNKMKHTTSFGIGWYVIYGFVGALISMFFNVILILLCN